MKHETQRQQYFRWVTLSLFLDAEGYTQPTKITIFDTERNHYQIVHVGWENKQRVYGCSMHIDIKDEKIWIQWNATEIDIANELVEMGVAKQDIVNR